MSRFMRFVHELVECFVHVDQIEEIRMLKLNYALRKVDPAMKIGPLIFTVLMLAIGLGFSLFFKNGAVIAALGAASVLITQVAINHGISKKLLIDKHQIRVIDGAFLVGLLFGLFILS